MVLLPIAAAGILIGDIHGELHVLASSSDCRCGCAMSVSAP
jgi:hypothetical protein